MSKCVVQAVWTVADENVDVAARDREFKKYIVPGVQALPGFVQGIWARSADGTRSHGAFVFDDRRGAEALIDQMESNASRSDAVGVRLQSLETLDVTVSI
jgi:hypothetical protein